VLVALEGADDRGTCREQTGGCRPCTSVMENGGNTREQRAVWCALDQHCVRVALDAAQRSPAARDHGTDAGLSDGVAHQGAQLGGIGADAATEADVDRRRSRGEEALEVGIQQQFRVGSVFAQPEPGGDGVRWPVRGCGTRLGLCRMMPGSGNSRVGVNIGTVRACM
jgi:hypothetical protein